MAADIDLKEYNAVAQLLLEAFADSEISEREGSGGKMFSYVPPERYRYRLLKIFANGYQFHLSNTSEGQRGIKGTAHFIGEVPEEGVRYDIKVDVFEPWSKTKEGEIFAPDQSFMKLASAGLKAVAREMGLGLHLYDKAQKTGKAAAKPAAKPASKGGTKAKGSSDNADFDADWDGTEEVTFGKHKGDAWSEIEDNYLEFITKDPEKANKKALKEIARRQSEAGDTGASNAKKAMDNKGGADDDEFPF